MPAAANPAACAWMPAPRGVLAIGTEINGQGYNYIERAHPEKCVLCNICGVVCPDVAVGVVEE